jgi:hypothetical protein
MEEKLASSGMSEERPRHLERVDWCPNPHRPPVLERGLLEAPPRYLRYLLED